MDSSQPKAGFRPELLVIPVSLALVAWGVFSRSNDAGAPRQRPDRITPPLPPPVEFGPAPQVDCIDLESIYDRAELSFRGQPIRGWITGKRSERGFIRHGPAVAYYMNGIKAWQARYRDDHLMEYTCWNLKGNVAYQRRRVEDDRRTLTEHKSLPPWWWNVTNHPAPETMPVAISGLSFKRVTERDASNLVKREYDMRFLDDEWTKHGEFTQWYAPGLLHLRGNYRNGQKHGRWDVWSPQGKLSMQIRYEDGIVLEKRLEPPWWTDSKDRKW